MGGRRLYHIVHDGCRSHPTSRARAFWILIHLQEIRGPNSNVRFVGQ